MSTNKVYGDRPNELELTEHETRYDFTCDIEGITESTPIDNCMHSIFGVSKTAAELINKYETLEKLLESVHEIKQNKRRETLVENKDKAIISKKLVTLKHDTPVDRVLDEFKLKEKPCIRYPFVHIRMIIKLFFYF